MRATVCVGLAGDLGTAPASLLLCHTGLHGTHVCTYP